MTHRHSVQHTRDRVYLDCVGSPVKMPEPAQHLESANDCGTLKENDELADSPNSRSLPENKGIAKTNSSTQPRVARYNCFTAFVTLGTDEYTHLCPHE